MDLHLTTNIPHLKIAIELITDITTLIQIQQAKNLANQQPKNTGSVIILREVIYIMIKTSYPADRITPPSKQNVNSGMKSQAVNTT